MADGNGNTQFDSKLFSAKKKLLEIKHVPMSKDAPYKIYLRRNGRHLKDCTTQLEVDAFIMTVPMETIAKPVVTQRNSTAKR